MQINLKVFLKPTFSVKEKRGACGGGSVDVIVTFSHSLCEVLSREEQEERAAEREPAGRLSPWELQAAKGPDLCVPSCSRAHRVHACEGTRVCATS